VRIGPLCVFLSYAGGHNHFYRSSFKSLLNAMERLSKKVSFPFQQSCPEIQQGRNILAQKCAATSPYQPIGDVLKVFADVLDHIEAAILIEAHQS
jgi:hypothetical protein